jgi:hypothetical protein
LEYHEEVNFSIGNLVVTTLALGSWPKQRAYEGASQEWSPGVTFHAPRNVGECEEWTSTLPSEFPLWELESQWTPEFSKNDCKGQNPLDWGVLYIIGKILQPRCLKWDHKTHLGT